jgi:hypothetical protein
MLNINKYFLLLYAYFLTAKTVVNQESNEILEDIFPLYYKNIRTNFYTGLYHLKNNQIFLGRPGQQNSKT